MTLDQYYSIESGVSKRMSNNWQASVSYFATKRDSLIDKVIANPNQELFNRDQTWTWGSNVTALVQLPMGAAAGVFRSGEVGHTRRAFLRIQGHPERQHNHAAARPARDAEQSQLPDNESEAVTKVQGDKGNQSGLND